MKHVILLLVFFPMFLFAQEKAKLKSNLEGTYQIEFLKSAKEPIGMSPDLIEKIENARKEIQVSYVVVNEHCRIKVLPKNLIAKAQIRPLEEYVIVDKFDNQ